MDRLSDKFVPIFDLLDQLEDRVPDEEPTVSGEVLHLSYPVAWSQRFELC